MGNNRVMDGFRIRVYLEHGGTNNQNSGTSVVPLLRRRNRQYALRDGRSFKEVLLGKMDAPHRSPVVLDVIAYRREADMGHPTTGPIGVELESSGGIENFTFPRHEMDWLNLCLVGQIKGMYNPDLVQQALLSDGVDCHKKLKVWVHLHGVPLSVWHDNFFSHVSSKWGVVLKIDEETSGKSRFDVAKILLSVSSVPDIPMSLPILVNQKEFQIRVSTVPYEEEACWIDNEEMNSQIKEAPDSPKSAPLGVSNSEAANDNLDVPEAEAINTHPVNNFHNSPISKTSEGLGLNPLGLNVVPQPSNGTARSPSLVPITTKPTNLPPSDVDPIDCPLSLENSGHLENVTLLDVPIFQSSVSIRDSSDQSFTAPIQEPNSGLFTIKPKLLKSSRSVSQAFARNKLDRLQYWASGKKGSLKSNRNDVRGVTLGGKSRTHVNLLSLPLDNHQFEARTSLEVCKLVGLQFAANEKRVIGRFHEIEVESKKDT
ncbi:hypothetical protein V6N11_060932 [Hibiscus sabdariffa]|uniref:DUF4283 domain-containing protein n=1 Tax=Hibiscus sabdariffa TaxID=183260 RepID=A0ABR2QRW2_9ROSI